MLFKEPVNVGSQNFVIKYYKLNNKGELRLLKAEHLRVTNYLVSTFILLLIISNTFQVINHFEIIGHKSKRQGSPEENSIYMYIVLTFVL